MIGNSRMIVDCLRSAYQRGKWDRVDVWQIACGWYHKGQSSDAQMEEIGKMIGYS